MVYVRSSMVVWCFCVMPWSTIWSMGECEQKASSRPVDEYGALDASGRERGSSPGFFFEEEDHVLQCKSRTEKRIYFLLKRSEEADQLPKINSPLPGYCQALLEALATEREMLVYWKKRCALLGIAAAPSTGSNADASVDCFLPEELKMGPASHIMPPAGDDGKELEKESDSYLKIGNINSTLKRVARQFFVGN